MSENGRGKENWAERRGGVRVVRTRRFDVGERARVGGKRKTPNLNATLLSQHTLDCSLTTKQFIKFHFHLSLSTFESSSLFPDSLIKNYPHFYIQFSRKILKKLAGFQINAKSLFFLNFETTSFYLKK